MKLKSNLSLALACLALFISLGGVGYAAASRRRPRLALYYVSVTVGLDLQNPVAVLRPGCPVGRLVSAGFKSLHATVFADAPAANTKSGWVIAARLKPNQTTGSLTSVARCKP